MIYIMIIYHDAINDPHWSTGLTIAEVQEQITALQRFNADFTHVEAKEAKTDLPQHTWQTVSRSRTRPKAAP